MYDLAHAELLAEQPIELDFAEVKIFASPFFNFAIGQLLKDIQPESLNRLLKISFLILVGNQLLCRVIEISKLFYSVENNRKAVDEALRELAESA